MVKMICKQLIFRIWILAFQALMFVKMQRCPRVCTCVENSVICQNGCNTEIPQDIPTNTTEITINGGNFEVLRKSLKCQQAKSMTFLNLDSNNIRSIHVNAFECMDNLVTLSLFANFVSIITESTFNVLTNLKIMHIATYDFASVFKEICKASNLSEMLIDRPFGTDTHISEVPTADMEYLNSCKHLTHLHILGDSAESNFLNATFDVNGFIKINISSLYLLGFTNILLPGSYTLLPSIRNLGIVTVLPDKTTLHAEHTTNLNITNYFPGFSKAYLELVLNPYNIQSLRIGSCLLKIRNILKEPLTFSAMHTLVLNDIEIVEFIYANYSEVITMDAHGLKNLSRYISKMPLEVLELTSSINVPIPVTVDKVFFSDFPKSIKKLLIKKFNIQAIKNYTFSMFQHLEELDLSSNVITSLESYSFHGISSLNKLALSENIIHWLTEQVFLNTSSQPMHLFLDKNENIAYRILMSKFTNLVSVSASYINSIRVDIFINITYLDLSEIREYAMIYLGPTDYSLHIQLLNLSNSCAKWTIVMNTTLNITELDYSYCKSCLHSNISGNPLQPIKNKANIEFLHLSHCKLPRLKKNIFGHLPTLIKLVLQDNKFTYLEPEAFKGLHLLKYLDLRDNPIASVSRDSFSYLPNLELVYLQGNSFTCTCDLLWFIVALKTGVYCMGNDSLAQNACNMPPEKSHLTLKTLDLTSKTCETPTINHVYDLALCLGVVISVQICLLLWKYRWHFKYLIFLVRTGHRRYREIDEESEYLYDAFVAYSEKDLGWVKQNLLPQIDTQYIGENGFQLCLHHRDWVAGYDIAENIANSIERSRRTILILSNNFAASHWCQFELAMAHLKLSTDLAYRNLLVIVLLENILEEFMTPRIRYLLSTKTYLPWTDNSRDQTKFWKGLHRALRKPTQGTMRHRQDSMFEMQVI